MLISFLIGDFTAQLSWPKNTTDNDNVVVIAKTYLLLILVHCYASYNAFWENKATDSNLAEIIYLGFYFFFWANELQRVNLWPKYTKSVQQRTIRLHDNIRYSEMLQKVFMIKL